MQAFFEFLKANPYILLFLTVGLAVYVGKFNVKGYGLGMVAAAVVVVGCAIATWASVYGVKLQLDNFAKSLFYYLFMFGIGYSVGPKFFKAMKGQGWRFGVMGAFVPVVGLLTAWAVASIVKLDLGFAGGLVSGALTESPAIGTASEAIQALTTIPDDVKQKLVSHVAVADALCYVFGAFGVIYVCGTLGPKLLRINLQAEAEKVEAEYGVVRTKTGIASAWQPFEIRAYRLEATAKAAGKTVAEAENLMPDARLFVQRIRRGTEVLAPKPDTVFQAGDLVAVSGRREVLVQVLGEKATEVDDRELLDIPVASFDVFVSSKDLAGRSLKDLADDDLVHSVFLRKIARGSQEIPMGTKTVIERGDVLGLVGPESAVERIAKRIGTVVRPLDGTDFVAVGLAIFIGAALGATLYVTVGGTKIFLGTSVGALLAGVVDAQGDLHLLSAWGAMVGYRHEWSEKWRSTVSYSYVQFDNRSELGDFAYDQTHYAQGNLIWAPTKNFYVGLEYLYGHKEARNGNSGDDHRVQLSLQYKLVR